MKEIIISAVVFLTVIGFYNLGIDGIGLFIAGWWIKSLSNDSSFIRESLSFKGRYYFTLFKRVWAYEFSWFPWVSLFKLDVGYGVQFLFWYIIWYDDKAQPKLWEAWRRINFLNRMKRDLQKRGEQCLKEME